jgi:hypothetical protein
MADKEVRLIDANALRLMKVAECAEHTIEFAAGWKACVEYCKNDAPAIEAEPVKHGRWIKHRIDDPKSILHGAVKDTTCSVCGKSTPYNTEYCMHCGARMDLKDGDSE